MNDDLDALMDELKTESLQTNNKPISADVTPLSDDNINQYIMDKTKIMVESGLYTVESLKEAILASGESRQIESYAELYKAVVTALDTLTKINLQNKKAKLTKELKEMDIKAKAELPEAKSTNILIATREDIINKFLENNKKTIDIEMEDDNEKSK